MAPTDLHVLGGCVVLTVDLTFSVSVETEPEWEAGSGSAFVCLEVFSWLMDSLLFLFLWLSSNPGQGWLSSSCIQGFISYSD